MFSINHWENPRKTISNQYENNDFAYVQHGVKQLVELLGWLDCSIGDLKGKTILDYGCGTGRLVRNCSTICKKAVGYDPVENCIKEAFSETSKCEKLIDNSKIFFTNRFSEVVEKFDIVVSTNVFEHLSYSDCEIALNNIKSVLKPEGKTFLLLHKRNNEKFIKYSGLKLFKDGSNVCVYCL